MSHNLLLSHVLLSPVMHLLLSVSLIFEVCHDAAACVCLTAPSRDAGRRTSIQQSTALNILESVDIYVWPLTDSWR